MKCPYCKNNLLIVDEYYENFEKENILLLHMAGYCETCKRNFDWESRFVFTYNQDFREVNDEGEVIMEFDKTYTPKKKERWWK